MKNLGVFLLILLFLTGCGEKGKKIELIPDYDEVYKPAFELKIFPQIESGKDFLQGAEFKDLALNIYKKDSVDFPGTLWYRLYINEDGRIDKVSIKNRKTIKELDEYILNKMESFKFKAIEIDGKKVKYSYEWSVELPVKNADIGIAINVDEVALPVGGMATLAQNIKYPERAKNKGIAGKVFIKASINENGDVYNTEIIKSVDEELDKAASEAVARTKFTPGKLKGKTVKTVVTIPISFVLNN